MACCSANVRFWPKADISFHSFSLARFVSPFGRSVVKCVKNCVFRMPCSERTMSMTKRYLRPIWLSVCVAFLLIDANSEAAAQPVPILGYAANKNTDPKRLDAFKQGLTELGYSEGKNIRIDYREGVLDADYQPAAVAAKRATSTIPIVLLAVNDPVGLGLVKSLERPGTNVTGTTMYAPQLIGERLRILKRIIPNLDKIAMVMNGNNPNNSSQVERVRSEARGLGIEVLALDLRKPEEVEPAFNR